MKSFFVATVLFASTTALAADHHVSPEVRFQFELASCFQLEAVSTDVTCDDRVLEAENKGYSPAQIEGIRKKALHKLELEREIFSKIEDREWQQQAHVVFVAIRECAVTNRSVEKLADQLLNAETFCQETIAYLMTSGKASEAMIEQALKRLDMEAGKDFARF